MIEDEHRIAQIIKEGLEQESHSVDVVFDGREGFELAKSDSHDLVILDANLPGISGAEISKQLRKENIHTSILMLVDGGKKRDIARKVGSDIDNYIVKPFSIETLMNKVRLLTEPADKVRGEVLTVDDLTMNMPLHEVRRKGELLTLSSKEYSILEYMIRNKGRVLSKENIMSYAWDYETGVLPNNIEVFINYLRAKVDKPFDEPPLIKTIRGFGYKVTDTES